jgi:hypothetical protein
MKLTNEQKLQLFDSLGDAWVDRISYVDVKRVLGLFSVYDAAKALRIAHNQVTYHINRGHIPALSVKIGQRWYWTREEYERAVRYCSVRHYTPRAKIVEKSRQRQIRELYATGEYSQQVLAEMYMVSQTNISRIVNGK